MSNLNQEVIYATAFIDAEGHIEFKTRDKKMVEVRFIHVNLLELR